MTVKIGSFIKGVLSDTNNLTFTSNSSYACCKLDTYKTSGKWYCEMKITIGSDIDGEVGITDFDYALDVSSGGVNPTRFKIYQVGGLNSTHILGLALDMDNKIVKYYVDNILIQTSLIPTVVKGVPSMAMWFGSKVTFITEMFNYPIPEGYLPYETDSKVKTKLQDMKIGDTISCKYVATNGTIGVFSDLGKEPVSIIPIISSLIPNGSFYFRHIGYDIKGKMKLVADRNIQHSISWDTLNTKGIATGNGITVDLGLGTNYNTTIRLLTGGISTIDKDNEWDKIIAESNLDGTITNGDNNVWNWNGVKSWSSTSQSASYRTTRGSTTASAVDGGNTVAAATTIGFRPVLLVEQLSSPPIFNGQLLLSNVHNEDLILNGIITNDIESKYKILINDEIFNDYTEFQISPISVDIIISNNALILNQNKISIIMENIKGDISNYDLFATMYNNIPNGALSLSKNTVHNENIDVVGILSDNDLDKISYRIILNNIEKLTWSQFIEDPFMDYRIINSDLVVGQNSLKVEYKDNFDESSLGFWEQEIIKTNAIPTINVQVTNGLLNATISDPDNDTIQYKILINGQQKYPVSGYSTMHVSPYNIKYAITRNDILIGRDNTITVEALDSYNGITTQDVIFMGEYVGLMFMDETNKYYTNDIGQLLQHLDFGIITLGQTTEPKKVIVQNKFGFPITNIALTVQNGLPNINVELSKTLYPFIPNEQLLYENIYSPNEQDCFYIRLATTISLQSTNGVFSIKAKAQQV